MSYTDIGSTEETVTVRHNTESINLYDETKNSISHNKKENIEEKYRKLEIFSRMIPAITIYFTFFLIIYFTYAHLFIAYTIVIFMMLFSTWFSYYCCYYGHKSINKIEENMKTDYSLNNYLHKQNEIKESVEKQGGVFIKYEEVIHFIVIPTYMETKELLEKTLNNISQSPIAKEQMYLVVACELKEKNCKEKANYLINLFSDKFKFIMGTYHPPGLEGEIPGKGSNVSWALSKLSELADKENLDLSKIILTISDSDSTYALTHFEYLTYLFIKDPDRYRKLWQAPIIAFENFFEVPTTTRMSSVGITLHEVACMSDPNTEIITYSTYSLSFNLIKLAGIRWSVDVITEDWRLLFKLFHDTQGRVKVERLFIPVFSYGIIGDSYCKSVYARFTQAKRHSWGIREISYFIFRSILVFLYPQKNEKNKKNDNDNNYKYRIFTILRKISRIHLYNAFVIVAIIYPEIVDKLILSNETKLLYSTVYYCYYNFAVFLNIIQIPAVCWCFWSVNRMLKWSGKTSFTLFSLIYAAAKIAIFALPSQIIVCTIPTLYVITRLIFTDKFIYIVAQKPKMEKVERTPDLV